MKNEMKKLVVLVILVFFVGGCAATLPPTAPTASEAGISISAASLEVAERFSVFLCPMNDTLWAQESDSPGQSPAVGRKTESGEIVEGFWFRLGLEKRGLPLLLAVFPGNFSGKFLYLSRDGLEAFKPTGEPIRNFDGQRFGKDENYKIKILSEFGLGEEKLRVFWGGYFAFHRDFLSEDFSPVSFLKKEELKESLESFFGHKYQMPNGEVRFSNLPPESFKKEAIENAAITPKDKFLKHFRVGIPLDPLSGGLMGGAAVLNGVIGAASEKYPAGYYPSALVQRRELGPTFEKLARKYRQLLLERAEWERAFLIELRKEEVPEETIKRVLMKIGLP